MNNTKITQVSSAIIHESDFLNKSSYRRFMKGFDRAFEIQQLKDEGYIIFIDGKPMDKDENFIFGDLRDKPCFGIGDERCMYVWLGSTFCAETENVCVTTEEMKIFNNISYVSPKNIKKMRKM